ncbi:cystatin-F [Ictalurus furcatus]|uniref:cystatin-F n=1 Tax=Ictalurus furcatus TaxID=66913 RepID=UPI00234FE344|nr:cystatin-F [Ictalurus furcatus]
MGVELSGQSYIPKVEELAVLSSPSHTQNTAPVMNLYLVLLLSVLLAVHWSHGQDPVEDVIVSHNVQPLGDWSAINPNQEDVQKAARKAVENFNMKSKAKKYFKLVDVTSAQIKITNMINYKIDAIIGRTKCLKTEPGDLDSCDMAQRRLRCKFEVQYNPRNNQFTTVKMSCNK